MCGTDGKNKHLLLRKKDMDVYAASTFLIPSLHVISSAHIGMKQVASIRLAPSYFSTSTKRLQLENG